MKRIKRYLMVFLFVLMQKIVIATPQVSDLLYWNDSIYHVYPSVFRNDARFQRLSSLIDSLYVVSTFFRERQHSLFRIWESDV